MDGTELEAGPDVTAQMARVRYGDVCYKKFLDQGELDVDWGAFDGIAAQTREQFETKEKLRQLIYDLELIDGSRNVECPEYVSVIVQKAGLYPENGGFLEGGTNRLRRDGDLRRTAGRAEAGFRPAEGRCDYLPDGTGRGQNLPDVGAGCGVAPAQWPGAKQLTRTSWNKK